MRVLMIVGFIAYFIKGILPSVTSHRKRMRSELKGSRVQRPGSFSTIIHFDHVSSVREEKSNMLPLDYTPMQGV